MVTVPRFRKKTKIHERQHVRDDLQPVFRDEKYREALDREVNAHDTIAEAYITDTANQQECEEVCPDILADGKNLMEETVKKMKAEMYRRGKQRDDRLRPVGMMRFKIDQVDPQGFDSLREYYAEE